MSKSAAIFLPVLVVVALTFLAFLRVAVARARAAKEEDRDPAYYRAFIGSPEPEYAIVAVRHYGNLFEVPVLFYVGCVMLFVLNGVTIWGLIFAWGYVAARLLQSFVHLTYNNPTHRGLSFVAGWLFVAALWAEAAGCVATRL
jgi:hypothetical protein